MAAGTSPIFARLGTTQWADAITAANTTRDLTTGTSYLVFTAGAVDGSYLQKLIIRSKGTNVATVMRVFMNNGSATTTAANNVLIDEVTLPAQGGTEVAALFGPVLPLNIAMPAGYRIYVTLGTAVSSGYTCTGVGGVY